MTDVSLETRARMLEESFRNLERSVTRKLRDISRHRNKDFTEEEKLAVITKLEEALNSLKVTDIL